MICMDLIFFDLDGTLLDDTSGLSVYTKETLELLRAKKIAHTIATGRSMLSAHSILNGYDFDLPQIYNNGVTIWDPVTEELILENLLGENSIANILDAAMSKNIAPFVHGIKGRNYYVYHPTPKHKIEQQLIDKHFSRSSAEILPLKSLPANSSVTNISMIGASNTINEIQRDIESQNELIAYSGPAIEGDVYRWMDIHHCKANKGAAVSRLKKQLNASNIICFGDSDNDLSMFKIADECYAPGNAKAQIKEQATSVIGNNYEDGIALFLRERFSL